MSQRLLSDDRGFVLVLALVIAGVVSTIALLAVASVRLSLDTRRTASDFAVMRAAADGALARAHRALVNQGDAMRQDLLSGKTVEYELGSMEIELAVVDERHKADLNTADTILLSQALGALLPAGHSAEGMLMQARTGRKVIASPDELLPPCARVGDAASKLRHAFTVWTNGTDVFPTAATVNGQTNRPSALADGFAVYQITALVRHSGRQRLVRRSLILLKAEAPFIHILHQGNARENFDLPLCSAGY